MLEFTDTLIGLNIAWSDAVLPLITAASAICMSSIPVPQEAGVSEIDQTLGPRLCTVTASSMLSPGSAAG